MKNGDILKWDHFLNVSLIHFYSFFKNDICIIIKIGGKLKLTELYVFPWVPPLCPILVTIW